MSAVLLRKQLTQDDLLIWNRLLPATQSWIKSVLLTCVQANTVMKKLCDTVSELASSLLVDNYWPELLPFMFRRISLSFRSLVFFYIGSIGTVHH